eukprot:jgi/Antlo1/1972/144
MANIVFKKITSAATVQRLVDPMKFNVVLECTKEMKDDIEFDVIYSGDARCEDYDQKICSMLVGPIPTGKVGFVLETDPVNISLINPKQIFGLTSVIIIGKYKSQQFLRIGYVLNVRYPGIPDSKLVDYEEDEGQGEDIETSDSVEDDDENSDKNDENNDGEEMEYENEESVGENSSMTDSTEAECAESIHSSERESGTQEKNGEKDSGSHDRNTNEKHKLRTTKECIENTKYKEQPEQIKEELCEEVHESSFSEIQEKMEETIYSTSDDNKIIVNEIALDKTKIEIEFMEPPVTTVFEIDWDHEHTIEEELKEDVKRTRTSC